MTSTSYQKANFEGLADNYSRNRPQYPQRMLTKLRELLPEGALSVVDLASGTGISTRAIAKILGERATTIGIEPSDDMRRRAQEDTSADMSIRYRWGLAEDLACTASSLDLIFVGQALHWFNRPQFYAEAARALKPGGVVSIARNTRNWQKSSFVAEYEAFHEKYLPGFSRTERELNAVSELKALDWIERTEIYDEEWVRPMKKSSFLGMAQSSSKVTQAVANAGQEEGMAELNEIADRHADRDGFLVMPYTSVMVCGVKMAS
jgi:ubiquinone/menaquinone biosynthesis C-methylase UbiE